MLSLLNHGNRNTRDKNKDWEKVINRLILDEYGNE